MGVDLLRVRNHGHDEVNERENLEVRFLWHLIGGKTPSEGNHQTNISHEGSMKSGEELSNQSNLIALPSFVFIIEDVPRNHFVEESGDEKYGEDFVNKHH